MVTLLDKTKEQRGYTDMSSTEFTFFSSSKQKQLPIHSILHS